MVVYLLMYLSLICLLIQFILFLFNSYHACSSILLLVSCDMSGSGPIVFLLECEWLLNMSNSKNFSFHVFTEQTAEALITGLLVNGWMWSFRSMLDNEIMHWIFHTSMLIVSCRHTNTHIHVHVHMYIHVHIKPNVVVKIYSYILPCC
jgi:hypothetical protein